MNDFLNTLPWRLASIAALAVGVVSLAAGDTDVWFGLERVGMAFAAFYVIGRVAQTLLIIGSQSPPAGHSKKGRRAESHAALRQPAAAPGVSGMIDAGGSGVDGTTSL